MSVSFYSPLFWAASTLWSTINAVARRLARAGWIRQADLGCRVVSVGNLQAGGSGKTPIVARIAKEGAARGLTVCVLSRGYGGRWEKSGGVLAPGEEPVSAHVAGDEPALLHELAPGAWIGVGADRVAQFERIKKRLGRAPDLVILDDGFQHFGIRRDIDLVAVTARRPAETLFRDFRGSLRHAQLVAWTKGAAPADPEDPRAVQVSFVTKGITGASIELGLRPRVWLVTGVADPGQVRQALEAEGAEVERHIRFPDHARYDGRIVLDLLAEARARGRRIVVTGKDWVKWREHLSETDRRGVVVVEPEVEIAKGKDRWEAVLWGS